MQTTESIENGDGEASIDVIRRRARPRVILLFNDFTIAFAEEKASEVLRAPLAPFRRLPPPVEAAIRRALQMHEGPKTAESAVVLPGILIRAFPMSAASNLIAVFVERYVRREDLAGAAYRYGLTRRQLDVFRLVLQGLNASEIAEELSLAESTVSDHLKHLLQRTGSKNRAEMIAKILGWEMSRSLAPDAVRLDQHADVRSARDRDRENAQQ